MISFAVRIICCLLTWTAFTSIYAADRVIIGNVSRMVGYLKAMVRSMQLAHANREQAAELVSKRTEIPLKFTRVTVDE